MDRISYYLKHLETLDEYSSDEYHIYGLWLIELPNLDQIEMAAAIGVPAYQIGTAKAAATWRGLLDAWFNDACDWSGQGGGQELTKIQRVAALDVLRGDLEELWVQYEQR